MQNGSITRSERHRGHDVWEYRWREPGAEGRRKPRRIVIGTINRFADKAGVFRATSALRRDINMASVRCKGKPVTFPSWRITMARANLHQRIVGRPTPPK